ncbi:hypothetical protein SAMN04487831_10453 [Pseudobutyrivibrio sp. UC1225]|uniref:hypothetical protein n=1 Tax=Pseudobutyrivibrio sp. UC1225 TaxID=1798185 RepID=UPI0008E60BF1|nr:hypothetical protein [Pseudobutyrivibrio sp. UC1225]SFN83665.1 hypothetical protein SAMN04487831_10453 [Pseudobutyrivibrio sp. UC1225]
MSRKDEIKSAYKSLGGAHSFNRADKMIRRFYIKSGFFTEPFETVDSLKARLSKLYSTVEVSNVESIAVFNCVK